LRTLFALGIYTGLRLGDCEPMRWGEVDLVRRIIRRIPNKTARRQCKTVNVPLHPTLRGMLTGSSRHPETCKYVLPDTAALCLRDNSAAVQADSRHFEACGIRTHKPGTGFETVTGADGSQRKSTPVGALP